MKVVETQASPIEFGTFEVPTRSDATFQVRENLDIREVDTLSLPRLPYFFDWNFIEPSVTISIDTDTTRWIIAEICNWLSST